MLSLLGDLISPTSHASKCPHVLALLYRNTSIDCFVVIETAWAIVTRHWGRKAAPSIRVSTCRMGPCAIRTLSSHSTLLTAHNQPAIMLCRGVRTAPVARASRSANISAKNVARPLAPARVLADIASSASSADLSDLLSNPQAAVAAATAGAHVCGSHSSASRGLDWSLRLPPLHDVHCTTQPWWRSVRCSPWVSSKAVRTVAAHQWW